MMGSKHIIIWKSSENQVHVGSRRQCIHDHDSQDLDRRYSVHPKAPFLSRHQVFHHERNKPEILTFLPNHQSAGILNPWNIRRNVIARVRIILLESNLTARPPARHPACTSIPSKQVKLAHVRTPCIINVFKPDGRCQS